MATESDGAFGKSDIEGKPRVAARDAGRERVSNAGDAMRWTGSPKVENAGCSRVNGARGSGGRSPRAGRIESIILSRGLDAIRDSRIACQGWLSGHSLITFGIRGSQPVRFHEDCERGVSGIISRKARRR